MRPSTRVATRERMISIRAKNMLALVITVGFLVPKAAAQSDKYSKMAPVDQYLMERNV
jgi:energy-converting hydrogenase Eha subunit F